MKNTINWIKSHFFLSLFLFLTVVLFVFLIFYKKEVSNRASKLPTITPTVIPLQIGALAVDRIYPSSGSVELAQTRNSISVFFETEVDPKSIIVRTEPSFEFEIKTLKDFPKRVILEPLSPWVDKTVYQIKILKGVRSKDSSKELKEDIELEYKILPVKPPKYDRPV